MIMQYQQHGLEHYFLLMAVAAYLLSAVFVWFNTGRKANNNIAVLVVMTIAVTMCLISIVLRWEATGNGPFLTLYEVLISNMFSLGFIYVLIYLLVPQSQSAALFVLPLISMLGLWTLAADATPLDLPATYSTMLLWIHVGVGKVFLGMNMVATGLAMLVFIHQISRDLFSSMVLEDAGDLDELAWRFMAVAFVFHSLMLIAGAVWAQDAWGRFWAWDSLETWAFITWLLMGFSLHMRITYRMPRWTGSLLILTVFILAFLTFFGVPFTSVGPHKGII